LTPYSECPVRALQELNGVSRGKTEPPKETLVPRRRPTVAEIITVVCWSVYCCHSDACPRDTPLPGQVVTRLRPGPHPLKSQIPLLPRSHPRQWLHLRLRCLPRPHQHCAHRHSCRRRRAFSDSKYVLEDLQRAGKERLDRAAAAGAKSPKLDYIYGSGIWVHGSSAARVTDLSPVEVPHASRLLSLPGARN
jgi:hypothetical protein